MTLVAILCNLRQRLVRAANSDSNNCTLVVTTSRTPQLKQHVIQPQTATCRSAIVGGIRLAMEIAWCSDHRSLYWFSRSRGLVAAELCVWEDICARTPGVEGNSNVTKHIKYPRISNQPFFVIAMAPEWIIGSKSDRSRHLSSG